MCIRDRVVVYQPAGEFVEGGGAAGGDVEVAAEEDVVVGGECFADEGVDCLLYTSRCV